MKTIKHPVAFPDTYPLERIAPRENILFFDIETTGFSGDTSQLYLIGCVYFDGFGWRMIQWFADTRDSEPQLLDAFLLLWRILRFSSISTAMALTFPICSNAAAVWAFPIPLTGSAAWISTKK